MPRCLLTWKNQSTRRKQLQNGTNEQIVLHLEKGLQLNGLETPDELQIKTVTQQPTQKTPKTQTNLPPL